MEGLVLFAVICFSTCRHSQIKGGYMKNMEILLLLLALLLPVSCFSYNYSDAIILPDGVKKLLAENPDILASAEADLNGDKENDYIVINQYKDTSDENDAEMKAAEKDPRRFREIVIITSIKGEYAVAARSNRAVLCSDCGAEGEDPFLGIKAVAKAFTLLHKMNLKEGGTWGISSKFGYSKRDNKWQLVYFSGNNDTELKPDDFGLINLEDYDVNHYMSTSRVETWPEQAAKPEFLADDILFTDDGVAFVIRPDKTGKRHVAGDRFYHKMNNISWSADKKEIYFARNNDAWVIGSDGKNEKKLFRDVLGAGTYRYEDEGQIYRLVRSPDGKKFAASGYPTNRDYNQSNMYVMDSDGKNRKAILKGTNYDGISSPSWSPDSSKLAYYHGVTLKVMDINSGNVADLVFAKGSGLAWSKDGKRILTIVKGAFNIIEVENKNIKEIKCSPVSGQGRLFWSADEKSAITYTSDYIFMSPVEEGSKALIITGPEFGLIDGLCW
jgi:hypothetical protein